ncbi:MAG TPA: DNA methyltransferase, partial [Candidatus Rokubacteria bacterium]|nr:DNA methyltransferase [Candidatus Rokubacteria bacterium]
MTDLLKFPAPYYGGKQHAAPAVWAALGDVEHFCEPFCGTCAVLL